jgi:PhnB protein
MNKVKPVPEGYHTVTPYLVMADAARALEFYKKAFGAVELFRMDASGGKIGHAEIQIGNSRIMLADECPDSKSPRKLGGTPVSMLLYVENADSFFRQAVDAGAKATHPVEDKFYGDRMGSLEDPFGHVWHIGTHIEDVTPEQMKERMNKAC